MYSEVLFGIVCFGLIGAILRVRKALKVALFLNKQKEHKLEEMNKKAEALEKALMDGTTSMKQASLGLERLNISLKGVIDDNEKLKMMLEFEKTQYQKLLGQKKSSEVRTGKIAEQISPFLCDYPENPATAHFIGEPIDFIHFNEDGIVFVEVKSGKSQLSTFQRSIRDQIKDGKVSFKIYRIEGE